jgi:hypothetical protein
VSLRINSTSTFKERGLDANWTPGPVTRALSHLEHLPRRILDPACGKGAILDVLQAEGHKVIGGDIFDWGWPNAYVGDYLTRPSSSADTAIITNPPYRLAMPFLEKALRDGSEYVAFLLRLNFLESMRRKPFFEACPPSRVWVSSRRFEMHREGWEGAKVSSNTAPGHIMSEDVPILNKQLDPYAFAERLAQIKPDVVFIERVGAMLKQGVSSTFKFGLSNGLLLGVIAAQKIPVHLIAPTVLKRHFKLDSDKEKSRLLAIRLFPINASTFARKMDHNCRQ